MGIIPNYRDMLLLMDIRCKYTKPKRAIKEQEWRYACENLLNIVAD